jgi:cytidylate kinase
MTSPYERLVVAIDGPSGSGKSSVSRAVAAALGAAYLDTGAMYRALAWACLHEGIEVRDEPAVAAYAVRAPLRVGMDPAAPGIWVGQTDVSGPIRGAEVTTAVSPVATNLAVRAEMCRRQRALIAEAVASHGAVVAEGRDITTVVAPDAAVRILLTASETARLARRALEVHGSADADAVAATRAAVVTRDAIDSTVSRFTTAADGVVTVDTSELSFDESVHAVLSVVHACAGGPDDGAQAHSEGRVTPGPRTGGDRWAS